MTTSRQNWLKAMNSQAEFYKKSSSRKRKDSDFDWEWQYSREGYKAKLKRLLTPYDKMASFFSGRTISYSQKWLNENSELLWDARNILEDELSQHLFDCYLLLNISGYSRYFYPRINFDNFVTITNESDYEDDLPKDYCGLPLKLYSIKLNEALYAEDIKILSTELQLNLLNNFRQYFIKRGDINFAPSAGDIVFDCGACLGDISIIFAAFVGFSGEIHLFDPVPLHSRFCQCHVNLNPNLGDVLRIQTLAVGDTSSRASGAIQNINNISPGGCAVDDFETITLDDYVFKNNVRKIDYIKMDIEGSEIAALQGSSMVLRKFMPKLAICTYHRPSDLWEIPHLIKKLNPEYKIYFGHHTPKQYEAVYYAI